MKKYQSKNSSEIDGKDSKSEKTQGYAYSTDVDTFKRSKHFLQMET